LAAGLALVFASASLAQASPEPLATGTTTILLSQGLSKSLKRESVKVFALGPATLAGSSVTLPLASGSFDPAVSQSTVYSLGGLVFKRGKRIAQLGNLVLDARNQSLSGELDGQQMLLATGLPFSFAREGFGAIAWIEKLSLTSQAARALDKDLARPARKHKRDRRATSSKEKKAGGAFKANQVLGAASSTAQPSMVSILPGGELRLALDPTTMAKLENVKVDVAAMSPTTLAAVGPPPAYASPLSGGTISPTATAGIVEAGGGLKLTQDLGTFGGKGTSTISLGAISIDFGAKTATMETAVDSTVGPSFSLGSLGRSSIADLNPAVMVNPTTRTINVQNATATLQPVIDEVLNRTFVEPFEAIAESKAERFHSGDVLGTISFTVQTQ
jgi:hypothetical protein